MAINIHPYYTLDEWKTYWKSTGAGEVLWAQDTDTSATAAYSVTSLGTTVIVDRAGHIVYRDGGATSYERLRAEVERVL